MYKRQGQAQVLGRRHVAQEVGTGAGGDGAADGSGDVVVAHADIGHQRPEHIERGEMCIRDSRITSCGFLYRVLMGEVNFLALTLNICPVDRGCSFC